MPRQYKFFNTNICSCVRSIVDRILWKYRNSLVLYYLHPTLYPTLLCWRQHVSATVGHLKITKMYIEENYTQYDHSIGAYSKLATRSRRLDYTYWAKSTSSKWSIRIWWIYRVIQNDCRGFNNLPLRSPDATSCDFFLWGYVNDHVYVPPLPATIPELKVRIRTATETITADMLQTVWSELEYRVFVCRITKGAHIEHL